MTMKNDERKNVKIKRIENGFSNFITLSTKDLSALILFIFVSSADGEIE